MCFISSYLDNKLLLCIYTMYNEASYYTHIKLQYILFNTDWMKIIILLTTILLLNISTFKDLLFLIAETKSYFSSFMFVKGPLFWFQLLWLCCWRVFQYTHLAAFINLSQIKRHSTIYIGSFSGSQNSLQFLLCVDSCSS